MPCNLKVYDPETKETLRYVCDEDTTARLIEEDYAAEGVGRYTDVEGNAFEVDWTHHRLVGFVRRSDDGAVIASGGADGSQTAVPDQ